MTGEYTITTGRPPAPHPARTRRASATGRIRFILVGAVIGLTWAASLRGFMMALAGPYSTFTFAGTFGIIIPTGVIVGALLGWAEHQRRTGTPHPLLILAPLLVGIIPNVLTAEVDLGPIELALSAMIGGYSVSERGPRSARIVAGVIAFATIPLTFLAAKPFPDLSPATPHGAWFCTLASSLFVTLALASSIPMRRPDASRSHRNQTCAAETSDHHPTSSTSAVDEPIVHNPPTVNDPSTAKELK